VLLSAPVSSCQFLSVLFQGSCKPLQPHWCRPFLFCEAECALQVECSKQFLLLKKQHLVLSALLRLLHVMPVRCRFEFYFAYCEAAFDSRYLQDYQIVWQRVGAPHLQPPLKRRLQAVCSPRHSPCEDEECEVPDKESRVPKLRADTITTALFALYCVLAGVVVARQPRMLMALVSFAAGQISLKVTICIIRAIVACICLSLR
jgi:hypothetical protein